MEAQLEEKNQELQRVSQASGLSRVSPAGETTETH